jgi:hypothetical protein
VVLQDADVNNVGFGVANTGLNFALGNVAPSQFALNLQVGVGLFGLGSGFGGASNVANGTATIVTGGATAVGNQSSTTNGQLASAITPPIDPGVLGFWPALVFVGLLIRRR